MRAALVLLMLLASSASAQSRTTIAVFNHSGSPVGVYVRENAGAPPVRIGTADGGTSCLSIRGLTYASQLEVGLKHVAHRVVWSTLPVLDVATSSGWRLEIGSPGLEVHDLNGMRPVPMCEGRGPSKLVSAGRPDH